jgi:hypothetical protein
MRKNLLQNKTILYGILMILVFLFTLTGCRNVLHNTSSKTKVAIHIDRFEKDLFSIDIYSLKDSIKFLKEKYPDFFPLFTSKIIEIAGSDTESISLGLTAFVTDFTIYRVSKHVQEIFPSLEIYEMELSDAFREYLYNFPGYCVPHVISCISGFNQSIITADSLLAISLDKYLGPDDEFYSLLYPPVPQYMRYVMRPEKISSDAMLAWIITEFPYNSPVDNLLSQMIYYGRAKYCVSRCMSSVPDTLLWGFTSRQMDFCNVHEKRMWEYLVENKKLFVTDGFVLNQFINDAPFTKDFSQESPGKAVVWLGYRIVDSYMKNNRKVSLQELMQDNNYQKIMNFSRYNP